MDSGLKNLAVLNEQLDTLDYESLTEERKQALEYQFYGVLKSTESLDIIEKYATRTKCAYDLESSTHWFVNSNHFENKEHFSQKMKLLYEKYLACKKQDNPLIDENKLKRKIGKKIFDRTYNFYGLAELYQYFYPRKDMTATSIISWDLRPYKFKNEETDCKTKTKDIEYLLNNTRINFSKIPFDQLRCPTAMEKILDKMAEKHDFKHIQTILINKKAFNHALKWYQAPYNGYVRKLFKYFPVNDS